MAGFDLTLLRHSFIHLGVWRLCFLDFVVSKTPGVSRVIARPLYDPTEGFDAKRPLPSSVLHLVPASGASMRSCLHHAVDVDECISRPLYDPTVHVSRQHGS